MCWTAFPSPAYMRFTFVKYVKMKRFNRQLVVKDIWKLVMEFLLCKIQPVFSACFSRMRKRPPNRRQYTQYTIIKTVEAKSGQD
jgi:hypothetical protein